MATKKSQRIGIWIIAIMMLVSTLALFLVMILAPQNEAVDRRRADELQTQYQADLEAYQERVDAQAAELSDRYFETFSAFQDRVAAFGADGVTELATEDLVIGDGDELTNESTFTAYYIGWNPDGEVFDSSIDGDSLNAPFTASPGMVIEGWTEGVAGMNVGGVRELTIPSDLAYGEAGSGELIDPDMPLKFVIMVIPTPETIPQPEFPEELIDYWQRGLI